MRALASLGQPLASLGERAHSHTRGPGDFTLSVARRTATVSRVGSSVSSFVSFAPELRQRDQAK